MGPPAGSPFAGPSGTQSSAAAGLPFAGVPSELQEMADAVLADEPDHPEPIVDFDPVHPGPSKLTIGRLFAGRRVALAFAVLLLAVETITMQLGPMLTQLGIDKAVIPRDKAVLVQVVIAYIGIVVLNAVVNRARILFASNLGEAVMYSLRVRVFSHFQRLSLDWYTESKAGVLLSRMTSDIDAVTQLVIDGFTNLFMQALTLVAVTVILFWYDPALAAIVIGIVVPPLVALTLWFRRVSESGYDDVRDRIAAVLADLSENLAGIRVVTALNRRRHNADVHREIVAGYREANVYTAKIGTIYGPGSEAIGTIAQAVVLAIGGKAVLDGRLELGELAAFVLYVTVFFAPIQQLVQLYNTYQQGTAALRKLSEVLDTEPSVAQKPDAYELPPIEGQIELVDVTFGYDPAVEVLSHVSLTIEAGETIALVGETGAGKSTVAKLITRFHDPTKGECLIDGHRLADVTLESLRTQLGVVPQEPFLFNGTIRDNLGFANPEASDAELLEAIQLVGLGDLVEQLGDGLDSAVHERGLSLSGGERQLLALARAFLAHPRVLVLDEATSSLDLRSEARIESALDSLLEGRTAVIIAHRLATARKADRIAVIEDGAVVELGSHDELVASGGRYADMFATWESHGGR
ncbi:MAG: ABC transporter ATP-binding protein [Actinomycetia bacterium]|nr:ABC transporter ATP-binding protein [Actinomycetes bacterium]